MKWQVKLMMRLGKEKIVQDRTVDLSQDVRKVLMEMADMKSQLIQTITTAHQSIIQSAAEHKAFPREKKRAAK